MQMPQALVSWAISSIIERYVMVTAGDHNRIIEFLRPLITYWNGSNGAGIILYGSIDYQAQTPNFAKDASATGGVK